MSKMRFAGIEGSASWSALLQSDERNENEHLRWLLERQRTRTDRHERLLSFIKKRYEAHTRRLRSKDNAGSRRRTGS